MNENTDLLHDTTQDDPFEVQMRGYSRRQVDEFVARARNHARDLEERLARSLHEMERLRLELSAARQAAGSRPAHEEVSERIAQILKLADDEASAQKSRASEEITQQRSDAKTEADNIRAQAKEQSERMLAAAQEQAERAISTARAEAEKARSTARADAERVAAESRNQAEESVASAKAQAKQLLDEATARASAIHDGAERRLDLLKDRHAEAMRRLTEIRDVVTDLVAHDGTKGSLDEEVAKAVAATLGKPAQTAPAANSPTASAPPQPGAKPAPGPGGAQAPRTRPAGSQGRGSSTPAEPAGDDTARHAKPDGGQPVRPPEARRATAIGAEDVEAVRVIES
jgi:cell division septum initiation protein DivIVA